MNYKRIEREIAFLVSVAGDSMGMEAGDRQQVSEARQSLRLLLDVARAADALPIDKLICYASTCNEYEDNRLVQDYNQALTALKEHCDE